MAISLNDNVHFGLEQENQFLETLRNAMNHNCVRQEDLCELINCRQSTNSKFLTGTTKLSLWQIFAISKHLNINLDFGYKVYEFLVWEEKKNDMSILGRFQGLTPLDALQGFKKVVDKSPSKQKFTFINLKAYYDSKEIIIKQLT